MPILTFVTKQPRPEFDLWIKNAHPEIVIRERTVIDEFATQWHVDRALTKDRMDFMRREFRIDVFQTIEDVEIKLFMADMDSTIVSGETLDEMAKVAGIGEDIAEITARAMRGELDFEKALRERINLLKGQPSSLIDRVLNDMQFNEGAASLLEHLKSRGVYCVLVSGGFTDFTARVADMMGFDAHFGNTLDLKDGMFTGEVIPPILDKNFKLQKLLELKARLGLNPDQVMAVGDGANDLPMLEAAGIGVSYYGKPLLTDMLPNRVEFTDLSALAYLV